MDALKIMTQNKEFVISDFDMPKQKQEQARLLCYQYNKISPNNKNKKREILNKLLGTCSDLTFIEPSFQCDYGFNIHTSGLVFINFNCVMLDTSPINIGANCFIAPNVTISCSSHPIDYELRNKGILVSKPINIGKNVWIGANVTICGGVNIGDNCVIGAGSVVTKDIPSNVVAFGNPCKVSRNITKQDKLNIINQLNLLKENK